MAIGVPGVLDPRTGAPRLVAGESRRQELASFVRARREGLSPAPAGLGRTARRRVKGLRREEVAEAAGISVAWYTWIEQARDVNLSEQTVESLCVALRLDPQEREHLFQLAGHPAPALRAGHDEHVMTSVRALLGSLEPNPSYVLDTQWNLLAWNQGAVRVLGDFAAVPQERRNYVRMVFTDPAFRALFVNWEEMARCCMAHFRRDSVGHVEDPKWLALVDDLVRESAEFRAWWLQHEVAWPHHWQKELRHPELGRLLYDTFDLELFRPARLRIVTYTPRAEG